MVRDTSSQAPLARHRRSLLYLGFGGNAPANAGQKSAGILSEVCEQISRCGKSGGSCPTGSAENLEGLGYYARARNLRKAAQVVVGDLEGEVPADYAEFRKLPGVGEYIAAAVQSIAFNAPYAVVDGNVKRVLARLFLIEAPINQSASTKIFQEKADLLLDHNAPGIFNQAMMELGATVCRPQSPTCIVCPVNTVCRAFQTVRQEEFPVRQKPKPLPEYHIVAGVVHKGDWILITQRKLEGLLGGLWEFPAERFSERNC